MFITPPKFPAPGSRGQRITYDDGPPSGAMPGDLYVDPDCNLWQMGVDWELVGNIKGLQGNTGPQGTQGATGAQGGVGPKGDQGIQGVKGDTGSVGPKGDTGDTGPQGVPGVNAKLIQSISATTNATGAYTFTFPTAFAAIPRISADVQSATTDIFDVKVTAVSTTACSVQIGRTQASVVALLGLTILSVPASVGAQTVHIIAIAP